jgi:CBS domain-containing protein
LECPRFVNYVPSDDRHVLVRCVWSTDDVVRDLMTMANQVAVVAPSIRVSDAAAYARSIGVKHLLVCRNDTLVGVVCRCCLVPPILDGEVVADRMSHKLWTISDTDRLGDAAAAMIEHDVGLLPVVRRGVLLGVISRGDLLRAGVASELAEGRRCEACGSAHGIRPHPTIEGIEFCLECLDEQLVDSDFDEISCEQSVG